MAYQSIITGARGLIYFGGNSLSDCMVFGKIVAGMEVVDKIKTVPTESRGPHQNVPVQAVVIKKAKLEQ